MKSYKFLDTNNNSHLLIEGENLFVLNTMLANEAGTYDCIYIDPLYNAKNKNMKNYNDNVRDWLSFMRERLCVAKQLLSDKGVVSISIGEEVCALKLLCDEIFGPENKIAMITVQSPNQTEGINIINNAEYLLIYRKTDKGKLTLSPKQQEARCTTSKKSQSINTVSIPAGIKCVKIPHGVYKQPRQVGGFEDLELISKEPIVVKDGYTQNAIRLRGRWSCPNDLKKYFDKLRTGSDEPVYNKYGKELVDFYFKYTKFQPNLVKLGFQKPTSVWSEFLSKGRNELKDIIGENDFSYPKHSSLIKYIISLTTPSDDSKVLDFFAGSGTTMQAVAELNDENQTHLMSTSITLNENGIVDTVTLERLKRCSLLKECTLDC